MTTKLEAVLDGARLPDDEARAVWARFSEYMGKNPGDLAGFARAEGFKSVHPEHRAGKAVLVLSREREQTPYGQGN